MLHIASVRAYAHTF